MATGRTDGLTASLDRVRERLAMVVDDRRTALLEQVVEIRSALAASIRTKIVEELSGYVSVGENVESSNPEASAEALARLAERLADEDVRAALRPDMLSVYRYRLATATARLASMWWNGVERPQGQGGFA
jgi:hypothetical protein